MCINLCRQLAALSVNFSFRKEREGRRVGQRDRRGGGPAGGRAAALQDSGAAGHGTPALEPPGNTAPALGLAPREPCPPFVQTCETVFSLPHSSLFATTAAAAGCPLARLLACAATRPSPGGVRPPGPFPAGRGAAPTGPTPCHPPSCPGLSLAAQHRRWPPSRQAVWGETLV